MALVDGQPRTLGLKELLEVYVAHRLDVVRRRSLHRRGKAEDRLHLVDGLLVAILDIDEVIEVIRSSDDTAAARERLMTVFDLTETQTNYILEMPLRRLTKFSRIELEAEQETLRATIAALTEIIESEALLRKTVSDELAEVAKQFGTPRRTVLLESAGLPSTTAVPLEVTDDPCWVLLSSTGLLARTLTDDPLPADGARAKHDVLVSAVRATARGEVAAVTSAGRLVRLGVLDMPAVPATSTAPNLSGGAPGLGVPVAGPGRAGARPDQRRGGHAGRPQPRAGHRAGRGQAGRSRPPAEQGLVGGRRRSSPATGSSVRSSWPARTGTSSSSPRTPSCCTSTPPLSGRRAGPPAAWRASGSPPGARAVCFGAVDPARESVVVTVSGSSAALPGTDAGSVKVTPYAEYPAQGPRDRRRALPPVPARRGRADAGLGRAGAGAGGGRDGRGRRPAGRHRPAGRVGDAGQPADRGGQRADAGLSTGLRWRSPRPGRHPAPGSPGPRTR